MRRRTLHYGWIVVAVTFLALIAAAGIRSTIGVFVVPFEDEFGWTRDTISLAIALNLVFYGLVAPFAAAVVERWGGRRLMAVCLAAVGAGALLTTRIQEPWQLALIWGPLVGAATGAVAVPLSAIVATRWFVRRRGLVTGLLTAAYATGNLIFLPLLAWITETSGWRWALLVIAGVAAAVIPVVLLLMRDRPADVGLAPYGAEGAPPPPPPAPAGNPFAAPLRMLGEVRGHRDFWLLAGTFFICGWTTNGAVQSHFIPAAHDHGISEVTAAGVLALIGVFDVIGATASGWLTDRADPRRLLFAYYTLRGLALILLVPLLTGPVAGLVGFAVVYGLDWVATVPPTVSLCVTAFGRERAGIVFGWVFCAHMLGGAGAAWLAGFTREMLGDYLVAFTFGGMLAIAAGFASLTIAGGRRRPRATPSPAPEPA